MRISDWSSDVCSSDLRGFGVYVGSASLTYSAWNSNVEAGCFFEESEIDSQFEGDLNRLFAELDANATILTEELRDLMISRAKALAAKKVPADDFWNHPKIGRASCRARVCQYV